MSGNNRFTRALYGIDLSPLETFTEAQRLARFAEGRAAEEAALNEMPKILAIRGIREQKNGRITFTAVCCVNITERVVMERKELWSDELTPTGEIKRLACGMIERNHHLTPYFMSDTAYQWWIEHAKREMGVEEDKRAANFVDRERQDKDMTPVGPVVSRAECKARLAKAKAKKSAAGGEPVAVPVK
jgi:hypothetical protein